MTKDELNDIWAKVKANYPIIDTIDQLNGLDDRTIIFYPSHSDNYGEFLTGRALKQWIKDNYNQLVQNGHLKDEGYFSPTFLSLLKEDIKELGGSQYELLFFEQDPHYMEPCVIVTSDCVEWDDDGDLIYNQAGIELAHFISLAQKKGYKFAGVNYCGGNQGIVDNVRSYWIFD